MPFDDEVITMARIQPTLRICVPAAVLAKLQDIAAREALSLSAVSRRALMRGLGLQGRADGLTPPADEQTTSIER
jgi:hypothetical protein